MNIIGISGLPRAIPFKRRHWSGLDERIYRIAPGQDSAVALVAGGDIVAAAAQGRFDRMDHSAEFPAAAADYCLREAGLKPGDIDEVAHSFDYEPYRHDFDRDPVLREFYETVLSPEAFRSEVARHLPGFPADRLYPVPHHLAHAAAAYWTSGWSECLVLVMDALGASQSATAFHGRYGSLREVGEISPQDSIGLLYSLVTLHLGFEFKAGEYKTMELAPYGDPEHYRGFFQNAVRFFPDGSICIPSLHLNRTIEERENFTGTRKYLEAALLPARRPSEPIRREHQDLAAALQETLERVLLHLCGALRRVTGEPRIALAGGVALNSAAVGKLVRSGVFDEVYVQPAAGDDGSALGAALYRASLHGEARTIQMPAPFLGPAYSEKQVRGAMASFARRIDVIPLNRSVQTCARAARLIAAGRVVAWYRGRMEFGPRALGNRSVLADPSSPDMRDRINAMVRKNETFVPFPVAVTTEEAARWFEIASGSALLQATSSVEVRPEHRATLPAVTRPNGTADVQTVSNESNPDFHRLLQATGKASGREMLLNARFSVMDQPIVNLPREALDAYLTSDLDYLFLEDYLVRRRPPT